MSIFTQFSGAARTPRTINLGNASSTDATSVLAAARAERQARESQRLQTDAVIRIQRVWRGRRVAGRTRQQIVSGLARTESASGDVKLARLSGQNEARAMLVLFWSSAADPWGLGKPAILQQWCANGLQSGQGEDSRVTSVRIAHDFAQTECSASCNLCGRMATTSLPWRSSSAGCWTRLHSILRECADAAVSLADTLQATGITILFRDTGRGAHKIELHFSGPLGGCRIFSPGGQAPEQRLDRTTRSSTS